MAEATELPRIHLSAPDTGELEQQYVQRAMESGWIAPAGPDLTAFEEEIAARVGVARAVGVSSGTAALHLSLLGVGVKPGDYVLTSTMTFAATANAIVYCGAEPVFIDSEEATGNIDTELLEQAVKELQAEGKHIGAIVPVDLLGRCVNYTEIERISAEYGIPVVADAAESLGALHNGKPAGSFGDLSIVSFNGNKIMTTSSGGMILTYDEELADRARYLSTQARQPVVHYEHTDIGYNYRLSNILAALGRGQLQRLDEMMARRREIREWYRDVFADFEGVTIFQGEGDEEDNCWLTSIIVDPTKTGWAASGLMQALQDANIESRPLWKPMHLQPVFVGKRAFTNGVSQQLFETGLTLPSGSAITEDQQRRIQDVIDTLKR